MLSSSPNPHDPRVTNPNSLSDASAYATTFFLGGSYTLRPLFSKTHAWRLNSTDYSRVFFFSFSHLLSISQKEYVAGSSSSSKILHELPTMIESISCKISSLSFSLTTESSGGGGNSSVMKGGGKVISRMVLFCKRTGVLL